MEPWWNVVGKGHTSLSLKFFVVNCPFLWPLGFNVVQENLSTQPVNYVVLIVFIQDTLKVGKISAVVWVYTTRILSCVVKEMFIVDTANLVQKGLAVLQCPIILKLKSAANMTLLQNMTLQVTS